MEYYRNQPYSQKSIVEDDTGNETIRIAVRIRPLNQREQNLNEVSAVAKLNYSSVGLQLGPAQGTSFQCDACFDFNSSQREIFEKVGVVDLITAALEGYRSTAFAYGQTGAGKTFSMIGAAGAVDDFSAGGWSSEGGMGLLPRSISYLFEQIRSQQHQGTRRRHRVRVMCMEIYSEQVYDLMVNEKERKSLAVKEHPEHGFYVDGAKIAVCKDEHFALSTVSKALLQRRIGSHLMNARSNRSHCVVTLFVDCLADPGDAGGQNLFGALTVVDLAGSERLKETGSTGQTMKEATHINQSLHNLGMVITAIVKQNRRIPFRDSKLTKLLASSLGGTSRTLMVACVGPARGTVIESMRTLKFAMGVKCIKNKPMAITKMDPQAETIRELKAEVEKLRLENATLRQTLMTAPAILDGHGGGLPSSLVLLENSQNNRHTQSNNFVRSVGWTEKGQIPKDQQAYKSRSADPSPLSPRSIPRPSTESLRSMINQALDGKATPFPALPAKGMHVSFNLPSNKGQSKQENNPAASAESLKAMINQAMNPHSKSPSSQQKPLTSVESFPLNASLKQEKRPSPQRYNYDKPLPSNAEFHLNMQVQEPFPHSQHPSNANLKEMGENVEKPHSQNFNSKEILNAYGLSSKAVAEEIQRERFGKASLRRPRQFQDTPTQNLQLSPLTLAGQHSITDAEAMKSVSPALSTFQNLTKSYPHRTPSQEMKLQRMSSDKNLTPISEHDAESQAHLDLVEAAFAKQEARQKCKEDLESAKKRLIFFEHALSEEIAKGGGSLKPVLEQQIANIQKDIASLEQSLIFQNPKGQSHQGVSVPTKPRLPQKTVLASASTPSIASPERDIRKPLLTPQRSQSSWQETWSTAHNLLNNNNVQPPAKMLPENSYYVPLSAQQQPPILSDNQQSNAYHDLMQAGIAPTQVLRKSRGKQKPVSSSNKAANSPAMPFASITRAEIMQNHRQRNTTGFMF